MHTPRDQRLFGGSQRRPSATESKALSLLFLRLPLAKIPSLEELLIGLAALLDRL